MRFIRPLIWVAVLVAGAGAAHAARGITVKGSDTMVILMQRWAEQYMTSHPGSVVQVTGGGSGTGIAALINGTTDVCMASRPMKEDEKRKLRDRFQTMGVEIPVAKDGLSIYVHASNPIQSLTLAQLRSIYTGAVTNWKQVGGPDALITLYSRENSSGTYVYFKDNVLLGRDYSARCQTLPGTAAVVNAVAKDPKGIGYGGAAYGKGVRELAVKKDDPSPAVAPSAATVKDGSYPITRYLYLYTRTRPSGDLKKFTDWVLSAEGQQLTTRVGYFPVN
ncbi:MAG TPA: phosphate ABC transporter substrate-binding protein [Candidatus Eisenbacteria bacterium]|nr:phosphate ABC transporter substrate-binding protein [Candidatus Eisenbacteria bacterium]